MMNRLLIIPAILLVTGCSTTSEWGQTKGGAVYTYEKNEAGCSVTITSAREIRGGADIVIDPDCGVAVSAERIGTGDTWAPIVRELIGKLPGVD